VLALALIIADYPALFGQMGCYLAGQILRERCGKPLKPASFAAHLFANTFRRCRIARLLRRLATLRRRGRSTKYNPDFGSQSFVGTPERRAAAREQMELVQGLPDYYLMEKYWRMLEIAGSYPDFFPSPIRSLTTNTGIEQPGARI